MYSPDRTACIAHTPSKHDSIEGSGRGVCAELLLAWLVPCVLLLLVLLLLLGACAGCCCAAARGSSKVSSFCISCSMSSKT
jgi:hypothetical protein